MSSKRPVHAIGIAIILGIGVWIFLSRKEPDTKTSDLHRIDTKESRDPITQPPVGSPVSPALSKFPGDAKASTDPEKLFRVILDRHTRHQEAARKPGDAMDYYSTSMYQFVSHLTEARLWALAFPKEAEARAVSMAQNSTLSDDERLLGVFILGVLAKKGSAGAESVLLGLGQRPESDPTALPSVEQLASLDSQGKYKSLYWDKAKSGSLASLEVLAAWPDPKTVIVLAEVRESSKGKPAPAGEMDLTAQESLQRLDLLNSPGLQATLDGIITNPSNERFQWLDWAIRIERDRDQTRLKTSLRQRLDAAENALIETYSLQALESFSFENVGSMPHAQLFSKTFAVEKMDRAFDDLLIVYQELGGPLKESEAKRLRTLGYVGDPKARLLELLDERGN